MFLAGYKLPLSRGLPDHSVFINSKSVLFLYTHGTLIIFMDPIWIRKLALKDKLRRIKMEKGDSIPKYLTKFTECLDELGSIRITVVEDDMVRIELLGLPKTWHSYQDLVNGREKLPEWE